MHDIYARFAPRELQAELREGMVSKHRAMPQIDFSDEDVDAILAYLYALAVKNDFISAFAVWTSLATRISMRSHRSWDQGRPPSYPKFAPRCEFRIRKEMLVGPIIIAATIIIWPAAIIIGSSAVVAWRIAVAVIVVVVAPLLGGDCANCSDRHSHER